LKADQFVVFLALLTFDASRPLIGCHSFGLFRITFPLLEHGGKALAGE
jgi:hypothetical protein